MRRLYWLIPLVIVSCSRRPDDDTLVAQPTRVRVSPSIFLGDVVCREGGGMHRYQATLLDVTDGLEAAFQLPSSAVVSCDRDVEFEYVRAGRRYIALVSGFDRNDVEAQNPGSPLVVDASGMLASPRWTTTCWGYDNTEVPEMGGASGTAGEGGASGDAPLLGVESFSKTIVTVRGCETLTGSTEEGPTGISFDIEPALLGMECGTEEGTLGTFSIVPAGGEPSPVMGGQGGQGGAPAEEALATAACGDTLILSDVPPAEYLRFEATGYDAVTEDPLWSSECHALSVAGITVRASCEPALAR